VRNQLNKNEELCHKLEAKVVNIRKKVEKSNTQIKFLNISMTLDEILDSQRSPNDKSGLGYNKEEINTLKKPDACPIGMFLDRGRVCVFSIDGKYQHNQMAQDDQ
jgi:hypothetical protein